MKYPQCSHKDLLANKNTSRRSVVIVNNHCLTIRLNHKDSCGPLSHEKEMLAFHALQ